MYVLSPTSIQSKIDILQRVKNNRRVNQQKAEAIRLGRAHLGEKAQGKGRPVLKARKRGHSQIDESDDEDNSGDDPLSDGETDASPHTHGSKSVRSESHTPKRVKRVSRSKYQLVDGVMVDTSLFQSTKKNQRQEQSVSEQFSYSPQVQNTNDPFTQGLHQNAYAPTQQTEMFSAYNQIPHGYAPSQQMPTSNQQHSFFPVDGSGNLFYGDNSTGASDSEGRDSEGHGITGYRNN